MSAQHSLLDEFPRHYEALVRFLRHRLGNASQARDVANDTWVHLAEHADDDAPPVQDARAYFCTVAANLHLDHQRRERWLSEHIRHSAAISAGHAHAADVADGLMYRQALQALDAALAALPARTRMVFEACRIHGQPLAGVAAQLNVSLSTVERDLICANDQIEAALLRWRGEKAARNRTARGRRRNLATLLGLGAAGLLGTGIWHHWQAQARPWAAHFATPRERRLEQVLPDGSTLALDADSRADLSFTARQRAVLLLQGAAFFSVASDAERPFIVNAGPVAVTVLGTRFGVEIAPSGNVLVQVEAGRVHVARDGRVLADGLTAGQSLDIPPGRDAPRPARGPVAPWRQGRLHFDATPLGDALQRLSRYARMDLRADTRAAPLRVSGTVEIAHARDWLDALPAALPVRVERQPDGGLLIARR